MATRVIPRIEELSGAGSWVMPACAQKVSVHVVTVTTLVSITDNTDTYSVPVGVYTWEAGATPSDGLSQPLAVSTGLSDLVIITWTEIV